MHVLTLDTENTTFQKGNPFSRQNRCCLVSVKWNNSATQILEWEYNNPLWVENLNLLQGLINLADLIVGFNLKYDLHWLRRYGIIIPRTTKLWCCQSVQFVIENQQSKFPSLNSSCQYWKLGQKLEVVEKEYWERGIDTPDIPWEILCEYAIRDVDLSYALYLKQKEYLNPKQQVLCSLLNQDLAVLAEMEWNGLKFDEKEAAIRSVSLEKEIKEIDKNLKDLLGNYPFNFNSNDHVSCLLYGGIIKFVESVPYEHTYLSGTKKGLTETRFRHHKTFVEFPRLVEPLKHSELAKEGYWSTDVSTLNQLSSKGVSSKVIKYLLRRSELEKLVSTYYVGFPDKRKEMDWPEGELHSNLNQAAVVTGRLSSSGPNQQNLPSEVNELIQTRFL